MFVPKTVGGKLAKQLRDVDNKLSEITEDRIKIVERSGIKLRSLFHKANPWGNTICDKSDCLVCTNPYNESFNCDKRNVTYKTYCLKCKENAKKENNEDSGDNNIEPMKTYYGETHCSARERGAQHVRDYQNKDEDSHMFKHFTDTHNKEKIEDIQFGMTVLKQHYSSFSRQVHESILIFLNPHVLNSKSGMYNRCQVPRLTVMVGDKVASDQEQNQVKYDQVDLDAEVANIRNKHPLASSEEETRPKKRQKRWHVNKDRNKKKKDQSEDNTVSPIAEPRVLESSLSQSSKAKTPVVKENRDPSKLFPIFNHNDKFNANPKIEATKVKFDENPKPNTKVGAKTKNKLKSNGGNNSILKFLTPMRGKPSTKPNISSDPP